VTILSLALRLKLFRSLTCSSDSRVPWCVGCHSVTEPAALSSSVPLGRFLPLPPTAAEPRRRDRGAPVLPSSVWFSRRPFKRQMADADLRNLAPWIWQKIRLPKTCLSRERSEIRGFYQRGQPRPKLTNPHARSAFWAVSCMCYEFEARVGRHSSVTLKSLDCNHEVACSELTTCGSLLARLLPDGAPRDGTHRTGE
jgi:hypothetical protein